MRLIRTPPLWSSEDTALDRLPQKEQLNLQLSLVSGFHGSIQIGIGIAIAIGIGIACLTTASQPHSLTAFEIAGSARISIRQNPMFTGLC